LKRFEHHLGRNHRHSHEWVFVDRRSAILNKERVNFMLVGVPPRRHQFGKGGNQRNTEARDRLVLAI